jgi:ribonuclease HI
VAIFTDSNLTDTKKYRLNGRCSNNQTEQLAILKALESIQDLENTERTVLVSTDSRITLESLKNRKNIHTSSKKNLDESDKNGDAEL